MSKANPKANDLLVARYCQSLRNDIHRLTLDNAQLTHRDITLTKHINDLVKITHNQNQIIASQQQTLHQQLALMLAQLAPSQIHAPHMTHPFSTTTLIDRVIGSHTHFF